MGLVVLVSMLLEGVWPGPGPGLDEYCAVKSVSCRTLKVTFSGSFLRSESGLKKLETALFVIVAPVVVVVLRFVGGGETGLSVEVLRFSVREAIVAWL